MTTSQPSPEIVDFGFELVGHVDAALVAWRDHTLGSARMLLVEWFGQQLPGLESDEDGTFADRAEMLVDAIVHQWCQQRAFFTQDAVSRLGSIAIVAVERLGMSSNLGKLIGEFLDQALVDLDTELRAAMSEFRAQS